MENGECNTCGFDGTIPRPDTSSATDNSQNNDPDLQNQHDGGMPWWGLVLIAVGAMAIGIVVGVVILKKKV